MGQVNILIVVNVAEAIRTQDLANNLWMFDSNNTGIQGSNELHTRVTNGDTIVWTVVPKDPNSKISILGFNSINHAPHPAAYPNMIRPNRYPQFDGSVWGCRVNESGVDAQYAIEFLLGGREQMSWDPFITSINPV